jgi:hypothetical protein
MARIVGSDGGCTVAGYNLKFTTWSATFSQVVTDTSAFGDSFAQKRGGLMSGTFSAGGVLQDDASTTTPMPADSGNIDLAATGVAVDLQANSTASLWEGNAVIANFSPSVSNAGEATATVDGEFTGAITITWDESS